LPWFRILKKTERAAEDTAAAQAEMPAEAPATDDDNADAAPPEGAVTDAERRRRRRGSRGGRNRRKRTASTSTSTAASTSGDGDGATADAAAPRRAARQGRQPAERRADGDKGASRRGSGRGGGRRKQAPRRAPLPAAKRELLISVDAGEQRVAILEDDRVAEVYLERPERRSIAGNIYLGVVDNVLPGMEAAFVEIGLEKNGFLYVDEIVAPELEGKAREGKRITDLIQRGQQILVQAVKDPMKTKGARLTTEISLPGRFLVYVPYGEGLGVSRRIEEAERQRLKEILRGLEPKHGGVIVRTAADGASAEDIERDLVFLERLWKTIQARAKAASAPELVYQEAELPLRIVRDLFAGDFVSAYVDDDRAHRRIVGYLKKTSPHMLERVHRDKEKVPLFERYGVEREIASTLDRRVDLPSGGYLVFDYAEAFTVIDVNTGRFVGSRKKSSTQRLEDTIVKNNLEAVKEVVRQLRLRDIGGIIVIDFIDMANPKNRQAVEEALRTELERDRTKTYVVEISPLGLVEMTRQNVTEGPREVMTRKCPACGGDGIVVSDATIAMGVERRLRALAAAGARGVQAYKVALHPQTLSLVVGPGGDRLAALEASTRRRFFLAPAEGHVHADHFDVLAEGKRDDLQPQSSVAEDAELELKLVEVGLHDPSAGVGKLDGSDVVVAGAAARVGKRVKIRVGRVLEGQVFATLVDAGAPPAPITFESEAEKPTRAPARRAAGAKGKREAEPPEGAQPAAAATAEAEEAAETEIETEAVAAEPGSEEGEAPGEGEAEKPKKKTRRGSRGGRRRKKKPTEPAEGAADEEAPAGEPEEDGRPSAEPPVEAVAETTPEPKPKPKARRAARTPKIHTPDSGRGEAAGDGAAAAAGVDAEAEPEMEPASGAAADGEKPKKKTRRGSRGGRRRRKPAEAVAQAGSRSGDDEPETAATATVTAGGGDYVPMSEWEDDFDA
jgi:ribonuclease G